MSDYAEELAARVYLEWSGPVEDVIESAIRESTLLIDWTSAQSKYSGHSRIRIVC